MDTETHEIRQARQRASVKWLLSKAYNNHVPDNIKEPFYRDHEHQEHLKPQIVVGLGNATLYCQTLSNLYSDPNYQSLNHWSILQALARKGVPVSESQEQPLTETVLIQTNPLRINAHMSVIESLMILYAKEISSGDRIPNAIRRISGTNVSTAGQTYEQCLLSWVSHACAALKKRIDQEIENGATDENGVRLQSPDIPPVRDFQDLCDGVCLALLISYYCPKVVPWTSVRINYLPAVEDSIHNVLLVSNFSQKHLPYSVFHMTPEDITYMRGSMKQNLVVLLADLFNLFEIHPAKCVCYPGMESQESDTSSVNSNEYGISYRRGLTCQPITPIPDLRSGLDSPTCSPSNRPPFQVTRSTSAVSMRRITPPKDYQQNSEVNNYPPPTTTPVDEGFVVHRSKGIPTLSSMQEPLVPARLRQAKEKNNMESKADERGDSLPAGRPSNWEQHRRPSFAGRRSRRNSSSEDSQLTIENFGGSQDQLNMIGRNMERERKTSAASIGYIEPVLPARSSLADARGTIQIGYDTDSGSEKQDKETEKTAIKRQTSMDNVSLRNIIHSSRKDLTDGDVSQNHTKQKSAYSQQDSDDVPKRKTSFANLPTNTTTWQQQSVLFNQSDHSNDYADETSKPQIDATKLSSIRMKLEEKRRNIEQEKRKMEIAMSKHQEKVGKAAFLQAINKGKTQSHSDGENKDHHSMDETSSSSADGNDTISMPNKSNTTTQDEWEPQIEYHKRTPDLDVSDVDKYQQSIAMMNSNLQDLQQDIHRLVTQQSQLQAQQLQAQQQMLQAQQISTMMQQQQPYGSQQHLSNQYRQMQQNQFGSTPHLSQQQSFGSPSAYPSRPPSRDPYQQPSQQQQSQLQPQQQQAPIQYINEHGQYVNQNSPLQPQTLNHHHHQPPIFKRENSQPFINIGGNSVGGGGGGGGSGNGSSGGINSGNSNNYENGNNYIPSSYGNPYPPHQTSDSNNQLSNQYQSNQFIVQPSSQLNRPTEYDDFHHRIGGLDHNSSQPNQFYLHDSPQSQSQQQQQQQPQQPIMMQTTQKPPQPPQRRTWAQSSSNQQQQQQQNVDQHSIYMQQQQQQPQQMVDVNAWQSQNISPKVDTRTWKSSNNSQNSSPGFLLHHNGGGDYNYQEKSYQNLFQVHSSPQHSRTPPRQISNMMTNHRDNRSFGAPQPPPEDMMAPQSISFIGDDDDQVDQIEMNIEIMPPSSGEQGNNFIRKMQQIQHMQHQQQQQYYDDYGVDVNLGKLNISSGNRTYRIPSPSRPLLNSNSFQDPQHFQQNNLQQRQENNSVNEKGFYISFDDQQPKRPKPPLRTKRSPKKETSFDSIDKSEPHSQLDMQLNNKKEQKHNSTILHSNIENNKSNTYNKLDSDTPIQLRQITEMNQSPNNGNSVFNTDYRRHLEDVTNQQSQQLLQQQQQQQQQLHQQTQQNINNNNSSSRQPKENQALIIGNEISGLDPNSIDEMEKKKEKIMLLSLQRRQQQEEAKARKEIESMQRREKEREKEEERSRKKEEQAARRAAILEAHRLKKAVEDAEREGKTVDREILMKHQLVQQQQQMSQATQPRLRTQKMTRPRPKTIHVETGSVDISEASSLSSRGKKGSSSNLTGYGQLSSNSMRRDYYRGSQDSLAVRESPDEYPSTSSTPIGRRGSYKNSREPTLERGRTLSRISIAKGSSLNFRGRKSNSLMNLCDTDSGIGRATPPRRAPSPGMGPSSSSSSAGRHLPSPSGPGSLPPGLMTKRRIFDDGSSDISAASSMMEYSGPKLYKQPAAKSNRGIILNAVEYCVFPGAVNRDAKQKVLEKIARSEAKHFLILFRDAGCQFRALYSYWPENEQILKLYGTGPSQVDEVMFDKFFKYNSGGKCFSQVHTKHLTVTIDAFTIHNSLWQGKKVNLPSKKDMALVI